MSAAHTPGPWEISWSMVGEWLVYVGRKQIAFKKEDEANARLVAAAPELLEALKIARDFMVISSDWSIDEAEINGEMRSTYEWLEIVNAAIIKATGSAQ